MKNSKPHFYQVIKQTCTLLNYLLNSEYNSQYVPLFSINCCYTTLIVYLIMRRRSYNKDTPPTTTAQLSPIYDDVKLPETSEQKKIIELQGNTAYGYIN